MSSGPTLKALFKFNNIPERTANLKRLALLFDELLYMLPETHPRLDGELLKGGRIRVRRRDGTFACEDFDFFRHTSAGFTYSEQSIHDSDLQETLAELRESGIAKAIATDDFPDLTADQFRRIRNTLAAADSLDDQFNRLSETPVEQYEKFAITVVQSVDEHGGKHQDSLIRAPNAVIDSFDLTDVLAVAHRVAACPVFIDPHHQNELKLRYEKCMALGKQILVQFPELESRSSVKPAFGAVSFAIANQIFDLESISTKSVSEIVRYRSNMAQARERYVSTDLVELTQLVESSPWGEKARRDIELYVMGKLKGDIALYHQAMRETWERMFGSLGTAMMTAINAGGTGGILGSLLPHSSLWEMAVVGAVAGLAKELPQLAKTVVDSVLAVRAQRRSGIAYFAEFD